MGLVVIDFVPWVTEPWLHDILQLVIIVFGVPAIIFGTVMCIYFLCSGERPLYFPWWNFWKWHKSDDDCDPSKIRQKPGQSKSDYYMEESIRIWNKSVDAHPTFFSTPPVSTPNSPSPVPIPVPIPTPTDSKNVSVDDILDELLPLFEPSRLKQTFPEYNFRKLVRPNVFVEPDKDHEWGHPNELAHYHPLSNHIDVRESHFLSATPVQLRDTLKHELTHALVEQLGIIDRKFHGDTWLKFAYYFNLRLDNVDLSSKVYVSCIRKTQ